MSNVRFAATLSALALGVIACTKTPAVETAASPSSSMSTSDAAVSWSGNISSVQESNSDVRQSGRGNGYGNAQMTPGDSRSSTRIIVNYSTGGGSSDRYLNWAILPGRCGAGSLPLLPISNFPELTVSGDGHAQVNVVLPFEFPIRGDFHINIYHERQQTLDQVVACGNLRASMG